MELTEEQETMKELIRERCVDRGITLVKLLSWYRRPGEPVGELIERVYADLGTGL